MDNELRPYFMVRCCLGKHIRVSGEHWTLITRRKHLEIRGKELEVQWTLSEADAVRASQGDEKVFLYYKKIEKYYLCVVCRCYFTDRLKEGHEIWRK
jgi:hypothetical protein